MHTIPVPESCLDACSAFARYNRALHEANLLRQEAEEDFWKAFGEACPELRVFKCTLLTTEKEVLVSTVRLPW